MRACVYAHACACECACVRVAPPPLRPRRFSQARRCRASASSPPGTLAVRASPRHRPRHPRPCRAARARTRVCPGSVAGHGEDRFGGSGSIYWCACVCAKKLGIGGPGLLENPAKRDLLPDAADPRHRHPQQNPTRRARSTQKASDMPSTAQHCSVTGRLLVPLARSPAAPSDGVVGRCGHHPRCPGWTHGAMVSPEEGATAQT